MFKQLARGVALTAGLALLPLATACGGSDDDAAADGKPTKVSAAPAAGVVAPAKVEVIAGLIGCTAKIRIDADELREGVCHGKKADYIITTFPEEKFKDTWLDSASIYGGTYLVGTRWVVAAKPEQLEEIRSELGGSVRQLQSMGAAPSAS